jgi:hypothetical protein
MNNLMADPGPGHFAESCETRSAEQRIFGRTVERAAVWNESAPAWTTETNPP